MFVEVTGEKLVGGGHFGPLPEQVKGASTTKNFQCKNVSPSLLEKFLKVCNCTNNLQVGLQSAIRDQKELCNGESEMRNLAEI